MLSYISAMTLWRPISEGRPGYPLLAGTAVDNSSNALILCLGVCHTATLDMNSGNATTVEVVCNVYQRT